MKMSNNPLVFQSIVNILLTFSLLYPPKPVHIQWRQQTSKSGVAKYRGIWGYAPPENFKKEKFFLECYFLHFQEQLKTYFMRNHAAVNNLRFAG